MAATKKRKTFAMRIYRILVVLAGMNTDEKMMALSFSFKESILSFTSLSSPSSSSRRRCSALAISSASSHKKDNRQESDNQRLQNLAQQANNNPLKSLNLNLDSLAQVGAASRAQELLQRIQALYTEGYYEVSPDVISFNTVLKAWKEDDQPEKALELLEAMIYVQQQHDESFDDVAVRDPNGSSLPSSSYSRSRIDVQVDLISFNTVIAAFANQGNYRKSLALLRQMQNDEKCPHPDIITYNVVLHSLAQSPEVGTAAQAESLLREMMQQQQQYQQRLSANPGSLDDSDVLGVPPVSVDTISFSTCINAWAREKDSDSHQHDYNEKNAHASARDAVSTESAQRAWDLLNLMEEYAQAGNVEVKPDIFSYTTTIQAFARSREPEKAQQVLRQMTGRGLQPSRKTYTALMSALSKAGQPEKAFQVLQNMMNAYEKGGMRGLKPDTVAFSSIIDGWSKVASVERPEAAVEALKLLEMMKTRSNEGFGPNGQTYTSVIATLAKCRSEETCEKARDVLREMEESSIENSEIRPSRIHYNAVLNAYAKSSLGSKAPKAQQLLKEMKSHARPDCRPDIISYNSLLAACANAFGNRSSKSNSFEIAMETFKAVVASAGEGNNTTATKDDMISPTSTTFANFAKCCRRLIPTPAHRQSALRKTLLICRKFGMLNHLIVRQVQTASQTEAEWREMAGELADFMDWKGDFRKCRQHPKEWTCNARR